MTKRKQSAVGPVRLRHACGHEKIHIMTWDEHMVGNARRIKAMDCVDCVLARARRSGLPVLRGSEKQVEWAMVVRQTFIEKGIEAGRPDIMELAARETASWWWIRSKDYGFKAMYEALSRGRGTR